MAWWPVTLDSVTLSLDARTTARPSGAKLRPRSNSGCWYMSLTRPPASSTHTTAEAWSHTCPSEPTVKTKSTERGTGAKSY
eukprot:scaffold2455_cov387-Prasinococcus_capsulatus_cf.AAC.17